MPEETRIPPDVQARLKDGAIGQYRIDAVIGAGGMGAVYKCQDKKLRREVAVKILLAPGDGKNIQRFLEEARILARLSHPNIVQVHDVGYDGHVPYFVMELVEGESLAQRLDRLGRIPVEEARDFVAQVASGLAAVHKLGVIHRDVKAANVLISPDGLAKLLDFGIARPVENPPHLTSQGLVMGTPSSMAPEQLRGEDLDQRADVYALGVLLYQLLTGQRPYEGEDPTYLAQQQELHPPTPVQELRPETPDDLTKILGKALAKRRDDRYWNCEELLKDLAPNLLHTTFHGQAPLPGGDLSLMSRRATRSSRRMRPAIFGSLGIVALAGLAAGGKKAVVGCLSCEAPVAGAEGRPPLEAVASGVFLWHDGTGWHVRAKSTDRGRQLGGQVKAAGGSLVEVAGIDEVSQDALVIEGRHSAKFQFDDPGAGEGFDFSADGGCIEVTVESAGYPSPELLRIGPNGTPAAELPARYCR
jgi:tRNA A-37 threonylcarbamoyl transferase component Bud32